MRFGFSVFLLLFSAYVSAQEGTLSAKDKEPVASVLNVSGGNNFSGFEILDTVVPEYKVFFTGENHLYRKSNSKLQLKMLKYLNAKAGVDHLFLEHGHSRAWMLGKYLETGDTSLFSIIGDYTYDEFTEFYVGLKEFNDGLDSASKLKVTGIDMEREFHTSIKVLSLLLPKEEAPAKISLSIETVRALALMIDDKTRTYKKMERDEVDEDEIDFPSYDLRQHYFSEETSLREVMKDYDSNRVIFEEYLGANFFDFDLIMKGLSAADQWNKYQRKAAVQEYIFREQFMYDRFLELTVKYPESRFYSQFGRCHTAPEEQDLWCGYYFFKTLASRINNSSDSSLKGKVLSIAQYYSQSDYYEKGLMKEDRVSFLSSKVELSRITLFDLNNYLRDSLAPKFPFVIINSYERDEDPDPKEEEAEKEKKGRKSYTVSDRTYALFRMGTIAPKGWKSLTDRASDLINPDNGSEVFFLYYGGSIGVALDALEQGEIYFDLGKGYSVNSVDDQIRQSVSYWNAGYRMGMDLSFASAIEFTPNLGFSYGRSVFERENYGNIPLSPGPLAENTSSTVNIFTNPFVLITPGVILQAHLKILTIGLEADYRFDISNKHWKVGGDIDQSSIKTSFSGYSLGVRIGLNIPQ